MAGDEQDKQQAGSRTLGASIAIIWQQDRGPPCGREIL